MIPLTYKTLTLEAAYRADLIVERSILVEVKAVEMLAPIHLAQTLTYLNLTGADVGLVVNFNVPYLRDGVRRLRRRPRGTSHSGAITCIPWPGEP